MEEEVRIRENEGSSSSLMEKIKEYKICIILCCALLCIIIIWALFFKGGSGTSSSNEELGHYDYLIVGSGLYGATFNYLARQAGKTTYVVEKRDVIGGNLYCEKTEGIFIHKYGPHIFHTANKKVWDFINNITYFNFYFLQTL